MTRKGGREVECAGLEIRYTAIPYRGFKSHPFRQNSSALEEPGFPGEQSFKRGAADIAPLQGLTSQEAGPFILYTRLRTAAKRRQTAASLKRPVGTLQQRGRTVASLEPELLIEAALLASRKPLAVRDLRRLFDDELSAKTVRAILASLAKRWSQRGLRLAEMPDGTWRFRTAEEVEPLLLKLQEERPQRYSRAAMETLAVIAYRQPVTRGDIEALRGVSVNPSIIRAFEERGWIETVGYRESPGRPALLATTKTFLADLGIKSLEELPRLGEAEEAAFALGDDNPQAAAAEGALQKQEEFDFEDQDHASEGGKSPHAAVGAEKAHAVPSPDEEGAAPPRGSR